jgi:hypothetical protein
MVIFTRSMALVVGLALIACVANMAIEKSGGYGSSSAPLMMAMAAALAIGSIMIGHAWPHGWRAFSVIAVVFLFAGETFALQMTAERTLESRDVRQAPLRLAAEVRAKATNRLTAANADLAQIGETPRLSLALAAKATANQAVVESAAKRGCASNCRKLLEQQVETADREVSYARAEISLARQAAEREVSAARAALAALPAVRSASPLADSLGIAGWKMDLSAAGLLSLGANGMAAMLLAFAAHFHIPAATRVTWAASKPDRDAAKEADWFARTTFQPQPSGRVPLVDLRSAYRNWCRDHELNPLPDETIGPALSELFSSVGLYREGEGDDAAIVGIHQLRKFPELTHSNPIA